MVRQHSGFVFADTERRGDDRSSAENLPCTTSAWQSRCHSQDIYARYTLPVFTGRVHGPWTRPVNTVVILDTREYGPSKSAGAIVNDVIIIFFLQGECPKWHPCSRAVCSRPVNTAVCTGIKKISVCTYCAWVLFNFIVLPVSARRTMSILCTSSIKDIHPAQLISKVFPCRHWIKTVIYTLYINCRHTASVYIKVKNTLKTMRCINKRNPSCTANAIINCVCRGLIELRVS